MTAARQVASLNVRQDNRLMAAVRLADISPEENKTARKPWMAWQKTEEQHHAHLHSLSKSWKEIALKYDPKWIECSMTKGFEKKM